MNHTQFTSRDWAIWSKCRYPYLDCIWSWVGVCICSQGLGRHHWKKATCGYLLLPGIKKFECVNRFHLFFRNNPAILGENNANLPRIVGIIADAFTRETFATNQEVTQRLINIVLQIKVHVVSFLHFLIDSFLLINPCIWITAECCGILTYKYWYYRQMN